METEQLSQRIYRSRDKCQAEALDCIERFYNTQHLHLTLRYASSMQFEAAVC
ncbi:MAG: hypothetical protein LBV45_00595 [Xanthomonadaceae bacterium]|nr:hypothetical protein [Xanthomonadaceae bacterium]